MINKKSHYFNLLKMGQISKITNNEVKNKVNSPVSHAKHNYYIQAFSIAHMDTKKVEI